MGGAPLTPISRVRASAPSMQLFGKKKKEEPPASVPKKRGGGGFFYDDEIDTVTQAPWEPTYAENGEVDLANVGGVYYLAFIPFLLSSLHTPEESSRLDIPREISEPVQCDVGVSDSEPVQCDVGVS